MFSLLTKITHGAINTALQPVRDATDIVDGLLEGELRIKAAARLGADAAAGMTISELLEWDSE